jgi:predicted phosphodiesterase
MKRFLTAAIGAVVFLFGPAAAGAQTAPDAVWIQWEADGQPHARAIVHGATCPAMSAGGFTAPMARRSGPVPSFPDSVCDALLPAGIDRIRVGTTRLPVVPHAPKRIVLFGDTGCRIQGTAVQACNDPVAWPFPAIAKDIAALKPDLVIHVGDYYYRESACPAGGNCANSPYGDTAASWEADYFVPMAPVFAVAPIVNVRGNHEDCKRGPIGWSRYLSGQVEVTCVAHEAPSFVAFDNLLLGDVDTATESTETLLQPPAFLADMAAVDAQAADVPHRETWLVTHRPPLAYLFTHEQKTPAGSIDALVSGHVHVFGAYEFSGEPPQLIVGTGGDSLDLGTAILKQIGGVTDVRFGYALAQRSGNGWTIDVHDVDTALHRTCRLEARKLSCSPALTGTK